jgi:hypothetical protein
VNPFDAQLFEQESFEPVQETANELGLPISTKYRASDDVLWEVTSTIEEGQFDLLLVGGAKSLFSESETGGLVQRFLREVQSDVGVFIERDFGQLTRMLLLLKDDNDLFLLTYAQRFLENASLSLTVFDFGGLAEKHRQIFSEANFFQPNLVNIVADPNLKEITPTQYDLLLVSFGHWEQFSESDEDWLAETPSVLIIRHLLEQSTNH